MKRCHWSHSMLKLGPKLGTSDVWVFALKSAVTSMINFSAQPTKKNNDTVDIWSEKIQRWPQKMGFELCNNKLCLELAISLKSICIVKSSL